jgi:hypothetical protein
MAVAEEQQAEGTVAALEVAMVPGQDALGVADMATPKASLIEANQQLGPEVQKLQDREDGAAAEQQPQSGDVALAEQARRDVGGGEGGGVKHGAMEGKGGGEVVTADKSGKKEEKTDKSGKKKEKKEDGEDWVETRLAVVAVLSVPRAVATCLLAARAALVVLEVVAATLASPRRQEVAKTRLAAVAVVPQAVATCLQAARAAATCLQAARAARR